MALRHILLCFCILMTVAVYECAHILEKRSFVSLGCMGMHDKSKYNRLISVCDECYELFMEPDLHKLCRSNCFNNPYFPRCVEALLLSSEKEELNNSVQQLYGKRK